MILINFGSSEEDFFLSSIIQVDSMQNKLGMPSPNMYDGLMKDDCFQLKSTTSAVKYTNIRALELCYILLNLGNTNL